MLAVNRCFLFLSICKWSKFHQTMFNNNCCYCNNEQLICAQATCISKLLAYSYWKWRGITDWNDFPFGRKFVMKMVSPSIDIKRKLITWNCCSRNSRQKLFQNTEKALFKQNPPIFIRVCTLQSHTWLLEISEALIKIETLQKVLWINDLFPTI